MNKLLVVFLLLLVACQPKQKEIEYGHDECHYCKMMIMENQYGTELVTNKAKIYKFDSVECLIDLLKKGEVKESDAAYILITSFDDPGKLKEARSSFYLHSKKLASPMGMYLTAFDTKEGALKAKETYGGEIYNWEMINRKFDSLK